MINLTLSYATGQVGDWPAFVNGSAAHQTTHGQSRLGAVHRIHRRPVATLAIDAVAAALVE